MWPDYLPDLRGFLEPTAREPLAEGGKDAGECAAEAEGRLVAQNTLANDARHQHDEYKCPISINA